MKKKINYDLLDYLDTSNPNVTEEQVLEYLASIIGTIYLKENHPDVIEMNEESFKMRENLFPDNKK